MRGGVSTCMLREAKANNPDLEPGYYDPTKPKSRLQIWDFNNLYGLSMPQPLPTGGYKWLTPTEIADLDFNSVPDDTRCILQVDLVYPKNCTINTAIFPWPLNTYR